jgi:hypothetical protein
MKCKNTVSTPSPLISFEDCRKILALTNSTNPAEELAMRARFSQLVKTLKKKTSKI